jgi:hypothetical protein
MTITNAAEQLARALLTLPASTRYRLTEQAERILASHPPTSAQARPWAFLVAATDRTTTAEESRLVAQAAGNDVPQAVTIRALTFAVDKLAHDHLTGLTDGEAVAIAEAFVAVDAGELHDIRMAVAHLLVEIGYRDQQVRNAPPAPPGSVPTTEHPPGAGSPGHQRSPVESSDATTGVASTDDAPGGTS